MKKTTIWVVLCFANLFHPVAAVENDSNYKNLTGKQRLELITRLFEKSQSGSVLSTTEQNFLKHYLTPKENLAIIDLRMKLRKEKGIDVDFYRQSNDLSKCNIIFKGYPLSILPSHFAQSEKLSSQPFKMYTGNEPGMQEKSEQMQRVRKLRFLNRIDDNRCVAVIDVNSGNQSILNPRWHDKILYGPIPENDQITLEQAKILWGDEKANSDLSSDSVEVTYKLVSGHPLHGHKRAYYYLYLAFKDKKLKKYKIRSAELCNQDNWIIVK